MDCVNHSGVSATAYCQNCGKALCGTCVCTGAGGQIFCQPCSAAWQTFQQPFVAPYSGGPHPAAAAVLGLIPGVGAMYNGQFFKGLIHVVIFAVLVSITDHYGIFGIFIAAWILYQSFEAYHTARALRDGQPPPDPLGLNEVGNWLNLGGKPRYPGQPGAGQGAANPGPYAAGPAGQPAAGQAPPPYGGQYQPPYQQVPYQGPGQAPFTPPAPGPGGPGYTPDPSEYWRPLFWKRKEPVGAVILIALGMLFLLGQLDIFHGRLLEFSWPVFLIGLGVWLIVRRLGESQGGSK
jgi:TM2 domain-containing membrane protein YozV